MVQSPGSRGRLGVLKLELANDFANNPGGRSAVRSCCYAVLSHLNRCTRDAESLRSPPLPASAFEILFKAKAPAPQDVCQEPPKALFCVGIGGFRGAMTPKPQPRRRLKPKSVKCSGTGGCFKGQEDPKSCKLQRV